MNMILYVDCIIIIIVIILHGTYVQCTLVQLCKQFWVFQNSRSTNSENNFHNVVFVFGSLSLSRYSRQTILPPEAMVQKQPCRWRRKKTNIFCNINLIIAHLTNVCQNVHLLESVECVHFHLNFSHKRSFIYLSELNFIPNQHPYSHSALVMDSNIVCPCFYVKEKDCSFRP